MGCGDAKSAAPATPELGTVLFCSRLNSLFCTFPTGGSRARLHRRQRFCGSMLLFCHTVRTRMHPLWYNHACTMHSWLLKQIASIALAVTTTRDEAPCSHASVTVLPSRPRDTGCLARSLCLRATAAAASVCTTAWNATSLLSTSLMALFSTVLPNTTQFVKGTMDLSWAALHLLAGRPATNMKIGMRRPRVGLLPLLLVSPVALVR